MTVFVCLFQLRHVCSNTEDRRYLYIRHHHPHCPWLWCVCETEPPEGLHCQGAQCQLYQRELQPHLAVPCFCRAHLTSLSGLRTLFSLLWLSFPRGNARRFSGKTTLITSPMFCPHGLKDQCTDTRTGKQSRTWWRMPLVPSSGGRGRRTLCVPGQLGLHSEILSLKK